MLILTHATGAPGAIEKQMILAVVPQYNHMPIRIHSYEFTLRVFQMQPAVPRELTNTREYFEDFSPTSRVVSAKHAISTCQKSGQSLTLVPSACYRVCV